LVNFRRYDFIKIPASYYRYLFCVISTDRKEDQNVSATSSNASFTSMFMSKQSTEAINMRILSEFPNPFSTVSALHPWEKETRAGYRTGKHITMPFECHKQNIKCCAYSRTLVCVEPSQPMHNSHS